MDAITIVLPRKVLETLERVSAAEGRAVEELISDAVLERFGITDPEARVELHLKLCEKYIREAEELLAKKDYVQASEKAWGAATQIVKAVAAREGRELRSHSELHREVARIAGEVGDEEVRMLWQSAGMLHQNFYENWLPGEMVEGNIRDVKRFVEKLRQL